MKSIYRGTTPLLRFGCPFEYAHITNFSITFAQDGTNIFKINMGDSEVYTVEDFLITVELTQEETNKFKHVFPVEAQLKILTDDEEIWVSEIEHYQVHRILDTDIMGKYEEENYV